MIVFTLTMPSVGSWNNRWTGEDRLYARTMKNCQVPKDVIGKKFITDGKTVGQLAYQ